MKQCRQDMQSDEPKQHPSRNRMDLVKEHSERLVAYALPEPEDSWGSREGFERDVVGLKVAVSAAVEGSLHQLSYVGEWHSHPRRSSPLPSTIDFAQIVWLGNELENEGLPELMAIAADDGALAFMLAGPSLGASGSKPRQQEANTRREAG